MATIIGAILGGFLIFTLCYYNIIPMDAGNPQIILDDEDLDDEDCEECEECEEETPSPQLTLNYTNDEIIETGSINNTAASLDFATNEATAQLGVSFYIGFCVDFPINLTDITINLKPFSEDLHKWKIALYSTDPYCFTDEKLAESNEFSASSTNEVNSTFLTTIGLYAEETYLIELSLTAGTAVYVGNYGTYDDRYYLCGSTLFTSKAIAFSVGFSINDTIEPSLTAISNCTGLALTSTNTTTMTFECPWDDFLLGILLNFAVLPLLENNTIVIDMGGIDRQFDITFEYTFDANTLAITAAMDDAEDTEDPTEIEFLSVIVIT